MAVLAEELGVVLPASGPLMGLVQDVPCTSA
jgi:hypothetical protein